MFKQSRHLLFALCAALVMQSAASACTITPMPGKAFRATGLIGQYCWVNPPAGEAVTGQCWGCTSSGGFFGGTSCGWHVFAGTAVPSGPPRYGYTFNISSDIGHTVVQCNAG